MCVTARAKLRTRMAMMVSGWGAIGLGYSAGRLATRAPYVLHENMLDRLVPFNAAGVWLYLSFFLLIPAAYLLAQPARLRPLSRAMQLAAIVGAACFLAWPTTLIYPAIPAGMPGAGALALLARFDSAQNCLPSLHGALVLLAVVALWQRERPWRTAFFLLWGLLVIFSVVQVRRHLSIDLAAGLMLGGACAWIVSRGMRRETPAALAGKHLLPDAGSWDMK